MKNVRLKEKGSNPLALPRAVGLWDGKELRTAPKRDVESPSWWESCLLGVEAPSLALEISSSGTVEYREVEIIRQPAHIR